MNNNVGEKFLPLGTVVILKGASKRLMITGFCSMAADEGANAQMYDYSGCMYPEGFISSEQTALFNHDQIETVFHVGLVDDEEKQFKAKLVELLKSSGKMPANETPVEASPIEEPVPPIGPGLPGYVAPEALVEEPVPPIGPGLPGYVAPTPEAKPAEVAPEANLEDSIANLKFDEE